MRVVIAGCGRVGGDLALTLSEEGHDVSAIDIRYDISTRGELFDGDVKRMDVLTLLNECRGR